MSLLTRFLNPIFPHTAVRNCIIETLVAQHKATFPCVYPCVAVPSSGKSTFLAFAQRIVPSLVAVYHGEENWMQTVYAALSENKPVFLFIQPDNLDTYYQTCPFPVEVRQASHLFEFESTFTENPVGATEFFHDVRMLENAPAAAEEFLNTYCRQPIWPAQ